MAEDTSLKQSRKRALSNKPTTPTPASNDANPQAGLRDGHKQALIAWDVVSKMYPSVPNHYPKPPELKEIPFLARQAASKAALAYADNEKRQFDLDSGSRGAQDRKLKAALAQAAGIPARYVCARPSLYAPMEDAHIAHRSQGFVQPMCGWKWFVEDLQPSPHKAWRV